MVPQMDTNGKIGWEQFSPEVSWFLYDFFKYELDDYQKLIFYGYYIQGFTLEEIGERVHCTFQRVAQILDKINGKLNKAWLNKDKWRAKHERQQRDK